MHWSRPSWDEYNKHRLLLVGGEDGVEVGIGDPPSPTIVTPAGGHVETSSDIVPISDANFYDSATAQLAVDGKIEQRPIAQPSLSVEPKP